MKLCACAHPVHVVNLHGVALQKPKEVTTILRIIGKLQPRDAALLNGGKDALKLVADMALAFNGPLACLRLFTRKVMDVSKFHGRCLQKAGKQANGIHRFTCKF